jgi:hypothetical protein
MKGGSGHKALIDYAKKRLTEQGVKILGYDVELESGVQVDILGVWEHGTVGVECYRQIQPKMLEKRISRLKGCLDRLVICVPDELEARKLAAFNVETWVAGLEIGYTNIKVPRRIVKKLSEIRKEGETLSDVIERLLEAKKG